jgi:hypothetical protein
MENDLDFSQPLQLAAFLDSKKALNKETQQLIEDCNLTEDIQIMRCLYNEMILRAEARQVKD